MKTIKVVVTHEGWFLFCPCWFGFDDNLCIFCADVMPIPKRGFAWLFECAIAVQQVVNWLVYAVTQDDDLCGFLFRAREIVPFEMELTISDEA